MGIEIADLFGTQPCIRQSARMAARPSGLGADMKAPEAIRIRESTIAGCAAFLACARDSIT
jgi:hypothetical protein